MGAGVDFFAVANVAEAAVLRETGAEDVRFWCSARWCRRKIAF